MSSLLNKARDKVEAALERSSNQGSDYRSDNHGQHSSHATNTADPSGGGDLDHRSHPQGRLGDHGHTQASERYGTTQGTGTFATSDNYGSGNNVSDYDNPRSTNAGPHSSSAMNKLDPRTDSDRDHRNDPTSRVGGTGTTQHYGDDYGRTGGAGGFGSSDTGYGETSAPYTTTSTTTGPHNSSLANKLDPRRDNDLDGRNNPASTTSGYGNGPRTHFSSTGVHEATTTGQGSTFDNPRSTNAGPHGSNVMNKLDPRHDSDRDHRNDPSSRVGGYGSTQTDDYGHTAGIGSYDNTRTGDYERSTGIGNRQPMSGTSDNYDNSATGYGDSTFTPGSGTANKTAGPHNSNVLNKLDPRVDSDMDGSKTYGGNQTHY